MATTAIPMKNDEEEALDWSDVALSMVGGEHVTYADLLAAVARKQKKTNADHRCFFKKLVLGGVGKETYCIHIRTMMDYCILQGKTSRILKVDLKSGDSFKQQPKPK